MSDPKKVTVMIAVPHLEGRELRAVVDELVEKGLQDPTTFDKLGLVSGTVEPDKMQSLRAVKGVTYVRPEEEMDIVRPVPND